MIKQIKSKTYLVTGGCGFIGSHLCEALINNGHKVIVLDNLTTGKKSKLPEQAELVVGDIRDEKLVQELINQTDGCFHLAAIVSMVQCYEDWVGCSQVNLTGIINVLNAVCHRKNDEPIPVVYASSCAIYGDNPHIPLPETENPDPLSSYGADKISCEYNARVGTRIYQIPTTGLRIFNVYGPRQNPDSMYSGVITIFLNHMLKKEPIEIYGDGGQIRDFIYVDDVVRAFISCMEQKQHTGEVYNVCTGQATSINDLAVIIERLLRKSVKIMHTEPRKGDVYRSLGDPKKILKDLGFKPRYSLEQGMQKLISYFQQH